MMEYALSSAAFVFGMILAFLLSGAEAAAIAANRGRFREAETMGDPGAAEVMDVLGNLRRILGATAAGKSLAFVGTILGLRGLLRAAYGEWPALPYAPAELNLADALAALAAAPLALVLNDAVARGLFRRHTDAALPVLALPLRLLSHILAPMAEAVQSALRFLMRSLGGVAAGKSYPRGDLARLFGASPPPPRNPEEAAEGGLLDTAGRSMIHNIVDLERTRTREIMRPLVHIVAVRLGDADLDSVLELSRRTGHSRFPVYRERMFQMLGFVSVYDILRNTDPAKTRVEDFVLDAYYAPEIMRANDLLQEFLERRLACAVLVNEYGACSGWITREDLLKEIIGELEDEFGKKPWSALRQGPGGGFVCEGPCNIDDLNEALSANFPKEGFETLAGWVYDALGRIPLVGESVPFEDFIVTVQEMDGPAVRRMLIRREEEGSGV